MDSSSSVEPVRLASPAACVERWTWRLIVCVLVIGCSSAFFAALVRLGFRGLQWMIAGSSADPPLAAAHLTPLRRAITPIVGALLASAVLWLRKRRAHGLGREPRPFVEYVEAVRHRHGRIPLVPNLWRTLSAAFSVSSGAAVGREGSMIQFAAAMTSTLAQSRVLGGTQSSNTLAFLVACGVAGGVTTAYNAPLAGVFFAAEIVLGALQWRELPLLGLAAGSGWLVSGAMLGRKPLYPAHPSIVPGWPLLLLLALAVLMGFVGPAWQWLLNAGRSARRLPVALGWGGLIVGLCSVLEPRVWGNGDVGLSAALGQAQLPGIALGVPLLARVFVLRLLSTLACVWTGTVGGVFTPTLFLGGILGALTLHGVSGGTALWAIAGMCCLLAAVTHAPLMATCIGAELTGDWRLLALLLPLTFLATQVARRLSPRALYAIASQNPEHGYRSETEAAPAPQTVH